jgi:hypothetical protein
MQLIIRNRLLVDLSDEDRAIVSSNFDEAKSFSVTIGMEEETLKRKRDSFQQQIRDRFKGWKLAAFSDIYPDSNEIASVMALLSNEVFHQTPGRIHAHCSIEVSLTY